jgi:RNase P subunit RPR2
MPVQKRVAVATDAERVPPMLGGSDMSERTCAACDYPLDENAIQVRIGGQTVEVCCDDCAVKLKEAHASAMASKTA